MGGNARSQDLRPLLLEKVAVVKAEIPDHHGTDDWQTPFWLLRMFAGWYDPCPLNGKGGLVATWRDPTFVNPPYSDPMPWVQKAVYEAGLGKLVVMLVKLDPSTAWYQKLQAAGAHFVTFNERLKFHGDKNYSAYFPSALVILDIEKEPTGRTAGKP
jgi:hypothetical protein